MELTDLTQTENSIKPNHHNALCTVCKSPQVKELEHRFLMYESQAQLARDYNLAESAICRHVKYLELEEKRGANTEKMLKIVLSRGFDKGLKIDSKLWIECARELNRITGNRQKERENEHDLSEAEKLAKLEEYYAETEKEISEKVN